MRLPHHRTQVSWHVGRLSYFFPSLLLVLATFPLSLLLTVKVVKEYERAVIFRLGRLVSTNEKVDSTIGV